MLFFYSGFIISQEVEEQDIHTEIKIYEEDDEFKIGLKFSFPEMTESIVNELTEIYVEFSLLGLIVHGDNWPDYVFEAPCSEDVHDFHVDSLAIPVGLGGQGSTHFWRSLAPANHLEYDPVLEEYYMDLYWGLCPEHHKALEMIGYVDVILNASDPQIPEPSFPPDNCARLSVQIHNATFEHEVRGTWGLGEQSANVVIHGPGCIDERSESTEESHLSNQLFRIYPNPASKVLHFIQPNAEPSRLQLFNTNGQLVYSENIQEQQTIIALEGLAPGVYFLQTQTKASRTLQKVMVVPAH